MRIELTSTLTQEDENRLAPALLKALSGLLDMLPIGYMLRIETTDEHLLEHMHPQGGRWDSADLLGMDPARPVMES